MHFKQQIRSYIVSHDYLTMFMKIAFSGYKNTSLSINLDRILRLFS